VLDFVIVNHGLPTGTKEHQMLSIPGMVCLHFSFVFVWQSGIANDHLANNAAVGYCGIVFFSSCGITFSPELSHVLKHCM
jgi:hypothetical protein